MRFSTGSSILSSQPKPYKYQPLEIWRQQVRLLKIKQDKNGPVHCTLQTFELKAAPLYAALSYTWGPESPACNILVDGKLLSIRPNLFYCLRGIRHECDGYIFVDQICIDQLNAQERNHQVQLMSAIYSRSQRVIVWLNDDTGDCLKAAKAFRDPTDIVALSTILSNEYFSRLWIVQEMLLTPEICIFTSGNTWISWESIWSITKDVNLGKRKLTTEEASAWKRISPNTQKLIRMTGNTGQRKESRELLDILSFSANTCYDPRDKVYGLMSLFEVEDKLKVDYDKPVFDVFVDVVMAFHAIIKFAYGRGYVQWLDVTQKVGINMGVDNRDVAALFAFLELVLPLETYSIRQNRVSAPPLVSTVGVEVRMDTTGLHPTSKKSPDSPRLDNLDAENRAAIDRAILSVEKSLEESSMPPTSIETAADVVDTPPSEDKDQNDEVISRFEYNFVDEIFRYQRERERRDSLHNEQRWDFTAGSIAELVSLQDEGLQLSWYYEHEGRKRRYTRPPGWQYIFRLPPLTMARIMRQCGKERTSFTDATTHQRRKLGKKANKRVDRAVQKLVLGRKSLVFFLITCIALLAIILIASFAMKLDLYTACLMLGIWGISRIIQRQTV